MENHKMIRRSFKFSLIRGNPIPALDPMGIGMGKKSPRLLNGDGDERHFPVGSRPVAMTDSTWISGL
jgi:hypothetical protein